MRLPFPTFCVILPFLVTAKPVPLPDDYVVGVFPSLDIIFKGWVDGVKQWLGILLPDLSSGDSPQQLFGTLGTLFTDVTTDTSPGVKDMLDTLKEPVDKLV